MQELKHRLLAQRRAERERLYKKIRPLYSKLFKTREDARLAFLHAKAVAEEVARYAENAKDQKWAKRCVLIAAIHPIKQHQADDIEKVLVRFLPEYQRKEIMESFMRFNLLRQQDEADPDKKEESVYRKYARPYVSEEKLVLLPPEAFVRTIDMSEEEHYAGKLHHATSYGPHDWMNRNLAHSILEFWRPAAIQLMLFRCYDSQSNIAAGFLYPYLMRNISYLFKAYEREIEKLKPEFELFLKDIIKSKGEIPIIQQTDRETKEPTDFTLRVKTPGSTTIKLVRKFKVDPEETDIDPAFVLEKIHDIVAGTIVSNKTHSARDLFYKVKSNHESIIVHSEDIFDGKREETDEEEGSNNGSSPDYQGVGHIDFIAKAFGGTNVQRTELHVRSYQSYLDYYLSTTSGRAVRESTLLRDAWGDLNYSILRDLGRFELHFPNGQSR